MKGMFTFTAEEFYTLFVEFEELRVIMRESERWFDGENPKILVKINGEDKLIEPEQIILTYDYKET